MPLSRKNSARGQRTPPVSARLTVGTAVIGSALLLSACGGADAQPAGGSGSVEVVATTTMLGDVSGRIVSCADPEGTVTTMMPAGADPHEFAASSKDATEMVKADLVVANGFNLEAGLSEVVNNARTDGAEVVEVAPEVDPIPFASAEEGHDHAGHDHEGHDHEGHDHEGHDHEGHDHAEGGDHAGHDHGSHDPHFWLDAGRMATGAEVIGQRLAEVTGDQQFAECGTTVHDEIDQTDAEVREKLAAVPAENRNLVTDHEAFGYFAEAYDFEVLSVVIPGGSTEAEPSAQEIAEIVHTIEDSQVRAIFSNNAVSTSLIEAVQAEAGTEVSIVPLDVGSLGAPGSPSGTYEGMMLQNADAIARALS